MKLYELTGEYERLRALAESSDNESEVNMALSAIDAAIERKAEGIGKVLAELEASAQAAADEAKRLVETAKRYDANAERLKTYMLVQMQIMGVTEIKAGSFRVRRQQNPEKVVITNEAALGLVPYIRTKVVSTIDKRAILDAYKSTGECIEGTEVVRDERVSFR